MLYTAQEYELTIPEPFQDRTLNVLMFGAKMPPEFNLVVSRDVIPKGHDLDYVIDRQIKTISGTQEKFKLTKDPEKKKLKKSDGQEVDAVEMGMRYKNKGNMVYQRHLFIHLVADKMLILVATTPGVWDSQEEQTWSKLIATLKLK